MRVRFVRKRAGERDLVDPLWQVLRGRPGGRVRGARRRAACWRRRRVRRGWRGAGARRARRRGVRRRRWGSGGGCGWTLRVRVRRRRGGGVGDVVPVGCGRAAVGAVGIFEVLDAHAQHLSCARATQRAAAGGCHAIRFVRGGGGGRGADDAGERGAGLHLTGRRNHRGCPVTLHPSGAALRGPTRDLRRSPTGRAPLRSAPARYREGQAPLHRTPVPAGLTRPARASDCLRRRSASPRPRWSCAWS